MTDKPEWLQAATDPNARRPIPDNITFNVVYNLRSIHEMLDRLGVPRFGSCKPYDSQLWNRMSWLVPRCLIIDNGGLEDDNI